MCGIAGILRLNGATADRSVICKMTQALARRGPDADGFFQDEHMSFGHRRLSIIDLSETANQPMFDNSGRFVIIFNGEIYNYKEVKAKIPEYPYKTSSDTEVVLAAYIKWGADSINELKGMFAFAIWDKLKKELFLVRDRMGVKPLYYYSSDKVFIFASEIRSILASGLIDNKIDPHALISYFAYQSFYTPQTIIKNVKQLPAASYLKVSLKELSGGSYWNICKPAAHYDFSSLQEVKKNIRKLLLQSVERRMVSDVPVAAFLSGGIDSSAVVGLMAEISGTGPRTFNISFGEESFDESFYAELVAKKFNAKHQKILLKPSVMLDELPHALNSMDSPSGDGINTYVVSKAITREKIKVALSGVGGDELFVGYPIFDQWLSILKRKWIWQIPGARSIINSIRGGKDNKNARMRQILSNKKLSIDAVYPVLRQVMAHRTIQQLTNLNFDKTDFEGSLAFREKEIASFPNLSQVSLCEYFGYTQHTLLKDTDQMSMAVSLEVREPFFDHELIEYTLQVPDHFKKGQYPKSLLVDSLNGLLPPEIIHRKKQGFLFPWSLWLKKELRSFGEEHIRRICERPFIQADALRNHWSKFINNDPSVRWMELWLFIILEYWLEKNHVDG